MQVHKDSGGTYGKVCITAELSYGRGIHVGKEQVQLLMNASGSTGYRNAGCRGRVGKASSLDRVRRRFRVDGPDRLWMTDIERHEALWTVR